MDCERRRLQLVRRQEQRSILRFINFVPRGRIPQNDVSTKIDTVIRDVQRFFAEPTDSHGRGEKTFMFETDAAGNALVRQVTGRFDEQHYHEDTWNKIAQKFQSMRKTDSIFAGEDYTDVTMENFDVGTIFLRFRYTLSTTF